MKEGQVRLTRISARYTESDLDVLFRALKADEEILIEIVHDGRDGSNPPRRAFKPTSTPERVVTSGTWSMSVARVFDALDRYDSGRWWRSP